MKTLTEIYINLVKSEKMTIEQVPEKYREAVREELEKE